MSMWKQYRKHPQFWAVILLLMIRVALLVVWWSGMIPFTATWARWAAVFDFLLLGWTVYGWWISHWGALIGFGAWIAAVFCGDVLWAVDQQGASIAILGAAIMASVLAVGLWLLRVSLSSGYAILSVAKTVVDEAVRMKIAVGLISAVMLLVCVLPFLLDQDERLDYRMQTYLTWTLSGSGVMLSLMTLYLACGTLCNDLSRRTIYLSLTKPIRRADYLLGKWLGIVMLNLLLVAVTGGGVYVFARVVERQQELNRYDRAAVEKQVLVAREAIPATPPPQMDLKQLFDDYVEQLEAKDPDRADLPIEPATSRMIKQAILAKWHTVAPLDAQTFLFSGLTDAAGHGEAFQLRLKPQSVRPPPGGRVWLRLWLNGRLFEPAQPSPLLDGHFHVWPLPASAVDPDGNLEVRIENVNPNNPRATFPSNVRFIPGEGLVLLYPRGLFGPNLARAMVVIWVRLVFLAALGLAGATFLSFPVACLLSTMIYLTASARGFLAESLQYYVAFPSDQVTWWERSMRIWGRFFDHLGAGQIGEAIKIPVRTIGETFVWLIPSFNEYNPVPLVSDGRWVGYETIGQSALVIGLFWTGGAALLAWLIFRRRELARVTV